MASLKLAINKVGVRKEDIFENAVKAKEQAEEKLDILLKKIDGWIWEIDQKGTCTICSSKVAEALGYSPKEMIGKEIFGFLPPNDAKKLKDMAHKISQEKTTQTNKIDLNWMHQSNKHPVWVRSFLVPIFDRMGNFHGLRCFSRDATEYQIAENKIQDLQKMVDKLKTQLHESIPQQGKGNLVPNPIVDRAIEQEFDYMILFDENAKIVDCTNDIQKKLGFSKEEMLSLTFSDVVYLESYDDIKACLDEIKKQGSLQTKNIHKKKDGSSVFVSEHIKYLKDRNLFICMVKQDTM